VALAYKETLMARYYFDIRDERGFLRDEDGSDFNNLDIAVRAAVLSAGEISRNMLAKGNICSVVIEVRDEQDVHVSAATASMKIDWCAPGSNPSPCSV
jgi:hypothetical protein